MLRRMFWLRLLTLAVVLSVSLSSVLAAVPAPSVLPPADPIYLPLISKTASHQLSLRLTEQLQWYNPAAAGSNYDLVIVQDYSYSMRFCWDTNATCASPNRRIDYATASLRSFVDEMLNKRNLQQGGDNRLAYVTFNQRATQRIPFNNDTNAALAAFKNEIGDLATPRTITETLLDGNTNITSGLVGAASYLNGARTVDKYGKPVRLVVLLFTDGLANVFNDGGYLNVTNRFTQAPFYCGENANDMDNPYVQATCPSDAEFPNINPKPLPPLVAMVKAANDARASKPITFYAVVLGAQFGLTPVDMRLNEVAPDNYYMANSPAELQALVDAIEQELGDPCAEQTGTPIPAGGAKVTIARQDGSVIGVFSANVDGNVIIPNLLPGAYTLSARHLDVIAAADPLQIARDYTRMIIANGNAQPVSSTTVIMPDTDYTFPAIKLVIDNELNAQCPN
jgi:hypothetical protein